MNWRLIFVPLAIPVELTSLLTKGRESGFGNWCFDRQPGDPNGKWWQTREEAYKSLGFTLPQK